MDGQTILPSTPAENLPSHSRSIRCLVALGVMAAASLWPQYAFAQAMGKVAIDAAPVAVAATAPAPAATVKPESPAVLSPVSTPAPVEITPAAPMPVAPIPFDPQPSALPKAPVAAAPNFVDSLPADPTKVVAPLRPIEKKEIRSSSAAAPAAASGDTEKKPATNDKSYLPSGIYAFLQVGAALAIVIGLILIGKALAKKFVPGARAGNGKGVIEILARYPLCKNQSIVLVRIGSQIVTLNQGKDQSHSVLVISEPTEVARIMGQIEGTNPDSIQAGFTRLLANARMDLKDPANDPDQADFETESMKPENLDNQLEEMAAAKRQLMELRQQVRSVRDHLPR